MSELFASIKAFIEKGNIIIFLLAVAVAIFTYQILAREILWSVFAFCLSYAAFYGIQNLYNDHKANIKQIEDNILKTYDADVHYVNRNVHCYFLHSDVSDDVGND